MGKIVLKTAKRDTSFNRAKVRDVVTRALKSKDAQGASTPKNISDKKEKSTAKVA